MSTVLPALRRLLAFVLCFSFLGTLTAPAFAAGGQTGNLNGTIVDTTTKAPIPNVTLTIVSPSQTLTAKTDAKGFFQVNGVPADTYTVRVRAAGYQEFVLSGVTVTGDQTVSLGTQPLQKALQTIGRSAARSVTSAFQPTSTTDQTTISGTRELIAAGKQLATNEADLALSVPGVVQDNAGALIIRGGLTSEVGYQLDGVPITEPFLNGNGTSGFYNGLGSLQIVAGVGDASQGNVGAGVVNIVPKRGTYPAFGTGDIEIGGPNFDHRTSFEYGFATKDGRFSDYISYAGSRDVPYYGYSNTDVSNFGRSDAYSYQKNDDILNNFIFRFGKDNNQSIKILADLRDLQNFGDVSGLSGRLPYYANPYVYNNPFATQLVVPGDNFANQGYLSSIFPTTPYQPYGNSAPQAASPTSVSPTRFFEAEYDNNLDANTYLQIKAFNFNQLNTTNNYYLNNPNETFGSVAYNSTGGSQTGVKLDITRTIGENNTLTFGASVQNNHPIWTGVLSGDSLFITDLYYQLGAAGSSPTIVDFATPSNTAAISPNFCSQPGNCYLYNALGGKNPGPLPSFGIGYNGTDYQIFSGYLRDQIKVGSKLKLDLGIREDLQNWKQGANPYALSLSNPDDVPLGGNASVGGSNYLRFNVVHPRVFQPRAAFNYEFDRYNAIAFSYGTSTIFPNAQTLGTPGALYNVPAAFNNIAPLPGTNIANQPNTWTCGSSYNPQYLVAGGANKSGTGGSYFQCTSYAQQLYWFYDQNLDAPDAGNNSPPLEVDKDFTYSHLFTNGLGLRATAYYNRSFNYPEENIINQTLGVFGVTNIGTKKVSGGELAFTTRDQAYGFNAFLSATYTNILNTVPPLVTNEDVLPLVSTASIKLNDIYRAGYISPFTTRVGVQYRFRNGFRINPVFNYDRGYPVGVGNTIATAYPGGYANLPQTNVNPPTYAGYNEPIGGSGNATNYVDATNPGTLANPNIAATRGTPETSAAGGFLSHPRLTANVTLEYQHAKNTLGFQVLNVFGNVYGEPIYNPYYQPVATGVAGPATGTTGFAVPGSVTYQYGGFRNIPADVGGNGAFIRLPVQPVTFRLYYQRSL